MKAFCWFTVIQNKINNLSIKLARIKNSITISPLHSGVNRRVINIMSLLRLGVPVSPTQCISCMNLIINRSIYITTIPRVYCTCTEEPNSNLVTNR